MRTIFTKKGHWLTRGENQAICKAFQEIEERALRYIPLSPLF
jgi:hypothetical protein